jgi:hypothetical protein
MISERLAVPLRVVEDIALEYVEDIALDTPGRCRPSSTINGS